MGNFFKTLGKGILYFITLPLLILFLAVYLVISIIGFIIVGIKALVLFFKGENITGKTAQDLEAEKRIDLWTNPIDHVLKEVEKIKANNETPAISMNPNDSSIHITGIPNQQNINQIPQQNMNNYGQVGYQNPQGMNQIPYGNQMMNNQVPPQNNMYSQGYPNQVNPNMVTPQVQPQIQTQVQPQIQTQIQPNMNQVPPPVVDETNNGQFAIEPEEVKDKKTVEFKKPDPNNIIKEEDIDTSTGTYSSINITPSNQVNDTNNGLNSFQNNNQDFKDPYYDEENDHEGVSFQEYLGDDKK